MQTLLTQRKRNKHSQCFKREAACTGLQWWEANNYRPPLSALVAQWDVDCATLTSQEDFEGPDIFATLCQRITP